MSFFSVVAIVLLVVAVACFVAGVFVPTRSMTIENAGWGALLMIVAVITGSIGLALLVGTLVFPT